MLKEKILSRDAAIGVVGLGYVGLPLAYMFHEAGFLVLGFDTNQDRVDAINRGESYIADVPKPAFTATADQSMLTEMDVVLLCVPTPLKPNKEPDLSYIIQEAERVSSCLHEEQLIVLESTTYPGTVREVVLPILRNAQVQRFYLAHVPERVDPGRSMAAMKKTPKIVGGIDDESRDITCLLYKSIADTIVPVSSVEVAEMTKVFENTFRNVNIALVNELLELCRELKISVWEVIEAADTKPYGFLAHYPGMVGGYCIPNSPEFLLSRAREYDLHLRFVEASAAINEQMPHYVVNRIRELLDGLRAQKILMLGITYKKDVESVVGSPAVKLMQMLDEAGAQVTYHDPYVGTVEWEKQTRSSVELDEGLQWADLVVVTTGHSEYDWEDIVRKAKRVFDTRGVTAGKKYPHVELL